MRKHILSKFAEKKTINVLKSDLTGTTKCTDSLESSDVDCFNQNRDRYMETRLTEKIEPGDVENFNIENGWTKATETIESSDADCFERNMGGDSTKLSAFLESSDIDSFC